MSTTALERITRGVDSSGRQIHGTRQNFQFYDRLNEGPAQGRLVIVQGSWSFADSSAGTHSKAMCMDYRTWNLTAAVRQAVVRRGRDLMGTMWYRTEEDGFDPHIHNNLIGDSPAAQAAVNQVASYRQGRNGLANNGFDRDPYRPTLIQDYEYIEDRDMTPEEHRMLKRLHDGFFDFRRNELRRDEAERLREKERFSRQVTLLGNLADELTVIMNRTSDTATRNQVKKVQERILTHLRDDPDVTEEDNPSEDGLAERNMG